MTGWWGGFDADPVVRQAMIYGASQDPYELGQALDVIAAAEPQVIVEIGCDRGGTLFAWRSVCERVYGITLEDNGRETGGSSLALETHGATVLRGDSHDPASLEWLAGELAGAPIDALVIDGDHSPVGVRTDVAMYGPLVRTGGGLILLHDVTPSTDPRSRVWEVWPEVAGSWAHDEIHNPEGGFGWGVIYPVGDPVPVVDYSPPPLSGWG